MQKQVATINQGKVTPELVIRDGRPMVSSLAVARHFAKEHKNVLRDVMNLDVPDDFRRRNFEPSSYTNQQNKKQPCFEMTRKGFVLLAMGYTGPRAMQFKIAYIEAFDAMERELSGRAARDAQADSLLEAMAKAANRGYPSSFIPDLVRYRRMGLSCEKCALLLGVSGSAVSKWSRIMRGAGVALPKAASRAGSAAFFGKKGDSRQLSLFDQGTH